MVLNANTFSTTRNIHPSVFRYHLQIGCQISRAKECPLRLWKPMLAYEQLGKDIKAIPMLVTLLGITISAAIMSMSDSISDDGLSISNSENLASRENSLWVPEPIAEKRLSGVRSESIQSKFKINLNAIKLNQTRPNKRRSWWPLQWHCLISFLCCFVRALCCVWIQIAKIRLRILYLLSLDQKRTPSHFIRLFKPKKLQYGWRHIAKSANSGSGELELWIAQNKWN